jgi:AbrB family looped-hinge helix DNA binding protein
MITTIDAAGRLVIPKEIRDRAQLVPGQALVVRYEAGRVEIEPAPLSVRLVKKGFLLVAEPQAPVEPLTERIVAETRETLRAERSEA